MLQVELADVPPELEQFQASFLLDGIPLPAVHQAAASDASWVEQLDASLRGSLQLHIDGELVPLVVRAEGDAAIELTGQGSATLAVNLKRTEACADSWCWLSPLPASSTFNRLWSFADNNIWAVGVRGLFMRWDGRAWRLVPTNPLGSHSAVDLWATSATDVWLFQDYSTIAFRWNGSSWAGALAPPFVIRKVWGFADGTLWVVGRTGQAARFDGTTWKAVSTGVTEDLSGVWGSAPDNLWAVGDHGTILHWDGSAFTVESQGTYTELFAVWGDAAGSEVWAAGRTGTIVHRTGGAWSLSPAAATEWLYGGFERSPSDVWAYGDSGVALHWNGASWTRQTTGVSTSLRSATVNSAGQLLLAGTGGTLVQGSIVSGWKTVTGGLPGFNDIWGTSENDLWIVGQAGTIYHFDGIRWKPVNSGYSHDLTAIWGSGPSDIWAVGWAGPKLHWDGKSWSAPSPTPDYSYAIWGSGPNDIWTAGDASGIAQHWDGTGWTPVDTGLRTNLYGLWGSDSQNIWTIGYGGVCARWNGTKWTPETLPVTGGEIYSGIFGTSDHDVWVATALYDMLHWDGVSWTRFSNGGVSGFRALWGSSTADIWSVGSYGVTTHYSKIPPAISPSWTVTYNGTSSYRGGAIRRIFGFDDKHIWAVGDDGTILQYRP